MKICRNISELQKELNAQISLNKQIGFVPTMGALHKGHISLVMESLKACDYTVASIFVNPTQFNNKEDLEKYPRTEEDDLKLLKEINCNCVFIPVAEEMYPTEDTRQFDFDGLDKVMEGAFRSGHFNGVAQIVSKLFDIVKPDKAFFGIKDFQQVSIVSKMVEKLDMKVEIVACPIIREENGLAMSSRNERLTDEERAHASIISKTLFEAIKISSSKNVSETKDWVIRTINEDPYMEVEYFDIVDIKNLRSISEWNKIETQVGCIAVNVGKVRLIDNVRF